MSENQHSSLYIHRDHPSSQSRKRKYSDKGILPYFQISQRILDVDDQRKKETRSWQEKGKILPEKEKFRKKMDTCLLLGKNTQVLNFSKPQAGHWPLVPTRRRPGSPLGALRVLSQGQPPSSGNMKASDMETLPYFRIWKSLPYSNRLRPTSKQLYKGRLNPRTIERHFKT